MIQKHIIIVAGEPNSIFLEIFFKSFKLIKINNFKKPIILIVSKKLLTQQMKKLGFNFKINQINRKFTDLNNINNNCINIIDVNFKFKRTFDKITDKSNHYIEQCFKIGISLMKKKTSYALINGPISKKNFLKEKFLGITEYLAKNTNRENKVAMLIHNSEISVSPITTHLPLKLVSKNLSKKRIIDHIILIRKFFKKRFNKNPKIAITGLNPHCESNYKTSEEEKSIRPAIKFLTRKKYNIFGPFAADTIFMKDNFIKYDVIVGMYHDQVLAPMKAIYGFNAINITLGLPFIRISPDHGPNIKMLGKNLSNPRSLIEALKFLNK